MPKVSVIVPVYNAERYLYQCVDSILDQTLKDIECILVDDGSTDSSPAICDAYAAQDSRVIDYSNCTEGMKRRTLNQKREVRYGQAYDTYSNI